MQKREHERELGLSLVLKRALESELVLVLEQVLELELELSRPALQPH